MQMFEAFLNSIPKNRSEVVDNLEIPDITEPGHNWERDDLATWSDSLSSASTEEWGDVSTDSSIPLSRAMTDSDIDYETFRRYKSRSFSDPWELMRIALDAFPPEYLESLESFQRSSENIEQPPSTSSERRRFDEELRQKMQRFFEECQVFEEDDPALEVLEEAFAAVDMKKIIDSERLDRKMK